MEELKLKNEYWPESLRSGIYILRRVRNPKIVLLRPMKSSSCTFLARHVEWVAIGSTLGPIFGGQDHATTSQRSKLSFS